MKHLPPLPGSFGAGMQPPRIAQHARRVPRYARPVGVRGCRLAEQLPLVRRVSEVLVRRADRCSVGMGRPRARSSSRLHGIVMKAASASGLSSHSCRALGHSTLVHVRLNGRGTCQPRPHFQLSWTLCEHGPHAVRPLCAAGRFGRGGEGGGSVQH
eukprot:scaffold1789_cov375-Prasinococcus_capsulatus_cf.AAC.12